MKTFNQATAKPAITVVLLVWCVAAVTVTIDESTQYQTIDGFGAFGAQRVWWSGQVSYWNPAFVDMVINDLGVSMLRDMIPEDFELVNDNNDPNDLDLSAFNLHSWTPRIHAPLGIHLPYLKALKQEADSRGEIFRLITTVWSPPAWMKNNRNVEGSYQDDPENHIIYSDQIYREFAEYCIAYIKTIEDSCGINLYALSMANEPAFSQTYNSCQYTSTGYADMIKVAGPIIHAAYPDVKLFGAEHMLTNWGHYEGRLMADPVTREHMDVLAVHGYMDGATPTSSSLAAGAWRRALTNASSVGKHLWMTETSGYGGSWSGVIQYAEAIYAALKFGHISAWTHWSMSIFTSGPSKKFYAAKQYFRYIRPNATMIEAVSDDENLLPLAFIHPQNRTFTVLLINSSATSKTVNLVGSNLPSSFAVYRTSASENCIQAGSAGSSIQLPGSSISTLFAQDWDPIVSIRESKRKCGIDLEKIGNNGIVRLYRIDGTSVESLRSDEYDLLRGNLASGTYIAEAAGSKKTLRRLVQTR